MSKKHSKGFTTQKLFLVFSCFCVLTICTSSDAQDRWYKGNLHTHTFWSDGSEFPEYVVNWYKESGYNFLVLTDHNTIHVNERWRAFAIQNQIYTSYVNSHAPGWADIKPIPDQEDSVMVRLQTFSELSTFYNSPGQFLLMEGNEITCPHRVHLVAIHQDKLLGAPKGSEAERTRMINEVVRKTADYRNETGRNNWPILAHPNHGWAITAEMILEVPDLRFFEVYNGIVNNDGDEYRASTERIWDIVLSYRLTKQDGELLYGIAADDAHSYHGASSGPGKGWIMVQTEKLSHENILEALDKGDFYASTGVKLKSVRFNGKTLRIEIDAEEGVDYLTEYIGTKRGIDITGNPTMDGDGNEIINTTKTYNSGIGVVLFNSSKIKSSYTFSGEELYVRVRITSSNDQIDPVTGKILGKQKVWVQPHIQK